MSSAGYGPLSTSGDDDADSRRFLKLDPLDDNEPVEQEDTSMFEDEEAGAVDDQQELTKKDVETKVKPGKVAQEEKTSNFSTVVVLLKAYICSGVLGLPAAWKSGGMLFSTLFSVFLAAIVLHAMFLLVKCKRKVEDRGVYTYGGVAQVVFGYKMSLFVDLLLTSCQCGICLAYAVFIGENLHSLYPVMTNVQWMWCVAPLLIVLANLRTLKALGPYAFVATVAVYLVITFIFSFNVAVVTTLQPDTLRSRHWFVTDFTSVMAMANISLYALEGVCVVLPVEHAMQDRSYFHNALTRSFVISTTTFILFGAMGYMAFGEDTKTVITLNLPPNAFSIVCKYAILFVMLFTFPVQLYPVTELMEKRLLHGKGGKVGSYYEAKRSVLRTALVLMCAGIGTVLPHFGIIISLIGSTSGSVLSLVLPSIFHLKLFRSYLPRWVIAKDLFLMLFGLFITIVGTAITLMNIHLHKSEKSAVPTPVNSNAHF